MPTAEDAAILVEQYRKALGKYVDALQRAQHSDLTPDQRVQAVKDAEPLWVIADELRQRIDQLPHSTGPGPSALP